MITSLRNILENKHTLIEETSYCAGQKELFDYPIVSGDFYEITGDNPGEKEIRFKNTVDVSVFQRIARKVPELSEVKFPDREQTPYFTANLSKLQEALEQNRPVAVEGGPCLFGAHEVEVEVMLQDGDTCIFDYCTGKRYGESTGFLETDMESFIKDHAQSIERVIFHDKKKGLTHQEYESILYVFEAAEALHAVAVIPLPDMSYVKYLSAVISEMPEDKKEHILKDFRKVSWRISELYLDLIYSLEKSYPNVSRIMTKSFPTDIEFYQNIYCNILVLDEQKEAYAVVYLDQSIGNYFPLDEVETEEVQQVYETGKAVWNKGKDDIAGTYTYIKVPVKNASGEVTGVVAVGTELIVLDQILTDIIKSIVAVLAVLVLLFCIFFEEVLAFLEDKRKFQEREKQESGIFPCHWIRLIIFGVFAAYNMTASFLPVYLMRYVQNAHFHNTELAASLPVTINIFVIGVTSLICQKLTVKLGIRKLAILSGLCSFAGNLMLFTAPSYILIVVGLILDGIGVGFMTNAVYILISRIVDPQSRMEGLAVYNSAYLAGLNFGIMLGSLLAVQFGQRNVFIFVSTTWVLLVVVIIAIGAMLDRDSAEEEEENETSGKIGAGKFLADKAVSSFFVLIQNPYIIFGSFIFYYVPLFCDNAGFSELTSTLLLLLYAEIPVILGNKMTQWTIERMKNSSMYLACGLNVLALLVFLVYPKLPGMILALILMGISACFGKPVQQMYFLDLESVKEYGEDKSIGIYNFTENIGESLGPVVMGQIMFISPLARGVLPLCMIVTGMGGLYYLINRKK